MAQFAVRPYEAIGTNRPPCLTVEADVVFGVILKNMHTTTGASAAPMQPIAVGI